MIINCTNCHTKYNINGTIIDSNGRKVKCIKCNNIWLVLPQKKFNDDSLNTIKSEIESSNSIREISQKRDKNKENFTFVISGTLIILILLFSVFLFKDRITSNYPSTQKIYNKLRYQNITGLSLENVQVNKFTEKDRNILIIHTSIKNNSQEVQNIPDLLILLTDKNKKEQYKELIKTNYKLKPGELYQFAEVMCLIDDQSDQLALELVNDIQLFLR